MSSRRHRIMWRAVYVALAVSAALCGLLLYWLLRPYAPVTTTPFRTDADTYVAGDVVTMSNEFCWDGSPFDAERFIVSSVSKVGLGTVAFPWGYARADVAERYAATGCAPSKIRVEIPSTTPAGDYTITYEIAVKVNPVRVWTSTTTSNAFTVTRPAEES